MTATLFATLYAVAIAGVIGFQIALILGAPWGRITQGGAVEGPLPPRGRAMAGVSVFINLAMGLAVLSAAEIWLDWPRWSFWAAFGMQSLVTLLNWITPSRPERMVWAPITSTMLALVILVWVTAP